MPPTESRVKMNGFAALDTASGICSTAIKRSVAAPSPEHRRILHFFRDAFAKNYWQYRHLCNIAIRLKKNDIFVKVKLFHYDKRSLPWRIAISCYSSYDFPTSICIKFRLPYSTRMMWTTSPPPWKCSVVAADKEAVRHFKADDRGKRRTDFGKTARLT